MRAIGRDPIFIERGEGAELIDVDGNRFVDYVCSWGPLIHGHAHPDVLAAVAEAAARGTSFGAPTAGEVSSPREVAAADAGRGDAAHDLLGHGGHDDRDAPRARGDAGASGSSSSRAPTTATSTACSRRPARAWRRTRCPPARACPRARPPTTVVVPWNDPDALRAGDRAQRARGDPRRAAAGQHGARAARARASSSCCASRPTPTARCSSSTR